MMENKSKSLSTIIILLTFLFIISFSLLIPTASRKFYYHEIEKYNIAEETGFKKYEIIDAYDSLMDYLWNKGSFSTGSLKYSSEGASHFKDVKVLFMLNFAIFLISSISLIILLKFYSLKKIKPYEYFGYDPTLYGGVLAIALSLFLGIFALIDFQTLFIFFHILFFPGRENWWFDGKQDEIIYILPLEYFRDCALIFLGILILLSLSFIIYSILKKKKYLKKDEDL